MTHQGNTADGLVYLGMPTIIPRALLFVPLVLFLGCSDEGQIKADDCASICGGAARLELAQNECNRIPSEQDRETCRLAAAVAFDTCHSRCASE